MQEKLSVKKVYTNACKYVVGHLGTFGLLTVFYYLGNLLPMLIGLNSFKVVVVVYYFLFLYIAAGLYYKQEVILKKDIFVSAGLRFLTVFLLFLASVLISSLMINLALDCVRNALPGGNTIVYIAVHSTTWMIAKYLFIFALVVIFLIIPSFAFVSEISGKARSILTTYVKVKGSIVYVAVTAAIAYILLILTIALCTPLRLNPFIVEFIRDLMIVFITVVYFKMYDFFYKIPQSKKQNNTFSLHIKDEDGDEPMVQADNNKAAVSKKDVSSSSKKKSSRNKGE